MEEEQYYDDEAGMFLPDRYVEVSVPIAAMSMPEATMRQLCAYYNQLELKNQ